MYSYEDDKIVRSRPNAIKLLGRKHRRNIKIEKKSEKLFRARPAVSSLSEKTKNKEPKKRELWKLLRKAAQRKCSDLKHKMK